MIAQCTPQQKLSDNHIDLAKLFPTKWGKWLKMESKSLLLTSIKNIIISSSFVEANCPPSLPYSPWSIIGPEKCTLKPPPSAGKHFVLDLPLNNQLLKTYVKLTTLLLGSNVAFSVENVCKVKWTPACLKCCVIQNSLSLIIRFYVCKVKAIGISEEQHCSLHISINLILCIMQDFPVEDKIRIKRAGRVGKCHIGCGCYWMVLHISVTGQQYCPDWSDLVSQMRISL